MMPGYSTSVNITETGLFLRTTLKSKFINGKTCYQKLLEFREKFQNGNLERQCKDFFQNISVMTTYGVHRVYRIDHINFDLNVKNKEIPVKDANGEVKNITLFQYYKTQYGRTVQDLEQPLLVAKNEMGQGEKGEVYLVPELCFLTGMSDEMKADENLKKNMMGKTRMVPNERMEKIGQIKKLLLNTKKYEKLNKTTKEKETKPSPNDIREEWGLGVGDFITIKGRELDPPKVVFHGNSKLLNLTPRCG